MDYDSLDPDTSCTICSAEFLYPEDLQQHNDQVHKSKLKPCHFCSIQCNGAESYAMHLRDAHLPELRMCSSCSKVFTDSHLITKHEKKHKCMSKTGKVQCSQCPEIFNSKSELENHEFNFHNNDKDGISLKEYHPTLSSIFNIKVITLLKNLSGEGTFLCNKCNYSTTDIESYIGHLQKENCKSITCNKCCEVFKFKHNLIRHLSNCSDIYRTDKTKKQCKACMKYINISSFKKHVKFCKQIKCSTCEIDFKTLSELSSHQSKEHPSSMEIKLCQLCTRECVGHVSLRKHIGRAHSDDIHLYKYKCVHCGIPFKHPQKLFAHYFMKHKNLSPYTCKICDKKFRVRKRFTLHIKLDHSSVGFVEFDEDYKVYFTDKKSENAFVPKCVITESFMSDYYEITKSYLENKAKMAKEPKKASTVIDLNSTDDDVTDAETETENLNQNGKSKKCKSKTPQTVSSDEDDQPLSKVSKKSESNSLNRFIQNQSRVGNRRKRDNRKQLTCSICNKYCYTHQNFTRHMTMHGRQSKSCIKCSEVFRSKEELKRHTETAHASSKLTETLKMILENRKKGTSISATIESNAEKFKKTIKRANIPEANGTATIKEIDEALSVQTFIENFKPDINESKNIEIESCVSVKQINTPYYRPPMIKMTKFKPPPIKESTKLAMPIKFKPDNGEIVKISIRLVQIPERPSMFTTNYQEQENPSELYQADSLSQYEDDHQNHDDYIPDVAHEVMLEGTDETPKPKLVIPHKIVIPQLPKGYSDIRIAHLLPEAPYYKIVKMEDMLSNKLEKDEDIEEVKHKEDGDKVVKLDDGTKLVAVNPLAHLLGNTPVEKVLQTPKSKYYKPKIRNYENLLSKAIAKASKPTQKNVKKSKES